jgi:hypothetical protein
MQLKQRWMPSVRVIRTRRRATMELQPRMPSVRKVMSWWGDLMRLERQGAAVRLQHRVLMRESLLRQTDRIA